MPKLDIPIKRLVERWATDWVRFVCPEARPDSIRPIGRELTPKAQSRLDEIFLVATPAGQTIVHFEAQGYRDPAFPARMLRYRADIWEHTLTSGQGTPPIHQAAIFFLPNHDNKTHGLEDNGIHYSYQVVRLWQVTRRQVISQGLTGLYPLLPLMQDVPGDTPVP